MTFGQPGTLQYKINCVILSLILLFQIILLEASKDVGGWVQTTRTPYGAVFEHGPRSLRGIGKSGMNTLELAENLGLEKEILSIPRGHPAMKNRFIYIFKIAAVMR